MNKQKLKEYRDYYEREFWVSVSANNMVAILDALLEEPEDENLNKKI